MLEPYTKFRLKLVSDIVVTEGGLKSAINANTNLSTLGVTATSASAVITIKSTSTNATTYAESVSSGATESITLGINQNPIATTLIGGTLTVGDQLKIAVYDSGLSGGSETVSYTTASGNTPTACLLYTSRCV